MLLKRIGFSSLALICISILSAQYASAQPRLITPRPSQKASVMQTIGVTDVSITYSRPGVKGRTIWADPPAGTPAGEATLDDGRARPKDAPLVYYGKLWRTGANEATLFTVTDDVLINGQPLAAGKYSLHTIPGKEEWTVIFNKDDGQWGSFTYDSAKDALRVKTKAQWLTDSQELLGFDFAPVTENSATVNIRWEKVSVPFNIEIKDPAAVALAKVRSQVAAAKSDDWQTPFSAGNWARGNKAPEDETKFFEQSLRAIDEQIKVKETFQNLDRKSRSLLALKRNPEAIAAAEKAVVVGKADSTVKPADIAALEKRIADMKAAKN
jgi:hypothetical protein